MRYRGASASVQGYGSYCEGKHCLRAHSNTPGQRPLGMDPCMEALQRRQRLSRVDAVGELKRIGQHSRNGAHSNYKPVQASRPTSVRSRNNKAFSFNRRLSALFPTATDRSG